MARRWGSWFWPLLWLALVSVLVNLAAVVSYRLLWADPGRWIQLA